MTSRPPHDSHPSATLALSRLSDSELHSRLSALVAEERRIGIEVINHLREIERRRLFAGLGYGSLFDYCTKELKYSESAAYRRIAAMRLIRDLPEEQKARVRTDLETGRLTITHLAQVHSAVGPIRRGGTPRAPIPEVLERVAGQSTRECQRALAELVPTSGRPDQERVLSANETEIRFTAPKSLLEKLSRIRGLVAHRKVNPGYAALLEFMAEVVLRGLDPTTQPSRSGRRAPLPAPEVRNGTSSPDAESHKSFLSPKTTSDEASREICQKRGGRRPDITYIPVALRRSVWKDANCQCSFVDKKSGRRCTSRYGLQIDHIRPLALGGETTADNLRLLCRSHNLWAAAREFGAEKVDKHFRGDP